MTNFKAKANVNFNIELTEFPEVKEHIKTLIDSLKSPDNPYPSAPLHSMVMPVFYGAELEFGDKLVYENGSVKVFPKAVFERFSNQMISLPNQGFGDVATNHEKLLSQLAPEERAELMKIKKRNLARYDVRPFLEKVS